jgi:microcystin-dependent protein
MANPFVAEIRCFPFNFPPRGWAFCDGQILPISQNTALFSLLGTTYGGDGKSNFALPNLQGSVPLGAGQAPGLSLYDLGQQGGSETITLLSTEMPLHTHIVQSSAGGGEVSTATGNGPGKSVTGGSTPVNIYSDQGPSPNIFFSQNAIGLFGGSQPHNNVMPSLTLNFCIALQGVFPPRS